MNDKRNPPTDMEHTPGSHRALSFPTDIADPPIFAMDTTPGIETAEAWIKANAHGKLEVIRRQIEALHTEARAVIEKARKDIELHRVPCRFEKKAGMVIHLYRRSDGRKYFSLLSPEDWGGDPPSEYLQSYRIRGDKTFEPLENRPESKTLDPRS